MSCQASLLGSWGIVLRQACGQSALLMSYIFVCSLKFSGRLHSERLISHVALVFTKALFNQSVGLFSEPHTCIQMHRQMCSLFIFYYHLGSNYHTEEGGFSHVIVDI